jgi:leucyl aminopeptidase (aminopeptidase T)
MYNLQTIKGAAKLVDECLCVKKGETAVVVADLNNLSIAEIIAMALCERGIEFSICTMEPRDRHGAEPTAPISAAMCMADIIFLATTYSMTHSNARREANAKSARVLSLPGYFEGMLISGGLMADFQGIKPNVLKVAALLDHANTASIHSSNGTDLRIEIANRRGFAFTGIADQPGTWAAPPAIEATISPVEETTEGILVVDGCLMPGGMVNSEVRIEFSKGIAQNISGGYQAEELKRVLASYKDPNVYQTVELGIGMNPQNIFGRSYLENETTYGTVHIGLGEGRTFGSKISASAHIDLVLDRPTLEIDGKTIVSDREIYC